MVSNGFICYLCLFVFIRAWCRERFHSLFVLYSVFIRAWCRERFVPLFVLIHVYSCVVSGKRFHLLLHVYSCVGVGNGFMLIVRLLAYIEYYMFYSGDGCCHSLHRSGMDSSSPLTSPRFLIDSPLNQ